MAYPHDSLETLDSTRSRLIKQSWVYFQEVGIKMEVTWLTFISLRSTSWWRAKEHGPKLSILKCKSRHCLLTKGLEANREDSKDWITIKVRRRVTQQSERATILQYADGSSPLRIFTKRWAHDLNHAFPISCTLVLQRKSGRLTLIPHSVPALSELNQEPSERPLHKGRVWGCYRFKTK